MKTVLHSIIFAVLNAILYLYTFASYFYFSDASLPNPLIGYMVIMYLVVGVFEYLIYLRPFTEAYSLGITGITAKDAAKRAEIARRKRAKVATKYVKEIYKDELLYSINRGLTSRKFTPSRLNSEIDDIHFVDVASMVAAILEKNGYHIKIDPVDEEYIKDFYCDNLSEKQLKDTQWVNEFKTLHSEWTVSWTPDEVKKNA